MIKLVLDGTVNSKLVGANTAQKVVSLAISAKECEQYMPFKIRRKFSKRVRVILEGRIIFDKALVYFAYDGALIITLKPYKETPRYVEKLRKLLGGELYERITDTARGNLRLGGTIHRSVAVTDQVSQHEIEAIVGAVSNTKPMRLAETAA